MIMKKIFAIILASVAIIALAASCNKAQQTPAQPEEAGQITIRAFMPEGTKVAFSEADNDGLHLAWEEGDCLIISNGSQSQTFEIKEGFTDHEAEFTGTAITGDSFTILYTNGDWESVAGAQGFDFTSQVQNGNGNTDHLRYVAWLSGVNAYTEFTFSQAWATEHGGTFNVPGIIKLEATLPEEATKLKSATLNIAGTEFTLGLKNVDVSTSAQVLTAYAMIPWSGLTLPAKTPVDLIITGEDDSDYGISFTLPSGADLKPGHVSTLKFPKGIEPLALFAGGSGTEADPYLIANEKHLCNMSIPLNAAADDVTTYFKLIDDITLTDTWTTLNTEEPWKMVNIDGQEHKIKNLKTNNTSGYNGGFFGILYGTLKNVTFTNVDITSSSKSAGAVACWAGANNDVTSAVLDNVHIIGGTIVQNAQEQAGGIAGKSRNATYTNCTVENVTITINTISSSTKTQGYGGISGWAQNSTFTNCSFDGTLDGARLSGGIVGYAPNGVNFTNCTSAGTITAKTVDGQKGQNAGGIVGWWGGSSISGCSSSADITSGDNAAAGIVANVGVAGGVIEKCFKTSGTVTSTGNNAGGIVGYTEQSATIKQCYTSCTVKSIASNAGGIIAVTHKTRVSVIQDCYSTGVLIASGQCGGGIAGELGTGTQVINCYSTATIDGGRALGGIVGRASLQAWNTGNDSQNTISGCIAWNPHIICTDRRDADTAGGSGTIVGFTSIKNTLTKGYRYYNIEFVPSDSDFDGTGVDQPDCDGTNWVVGTTPGTGKTYQCPYHGTAAASTATVSSVARDIIGWDASVWDFSADLPTLK